MHFRIDCMVYLVLTSAFIGNVRSGEYQVLRRQLRLLQQEQFQQKSHLRQIQEQMINVLNTNRMLLEKVEAIERGESGNEVIGDIPQSVHNLEIKYNNLSLDVNAINGEMHVQKGQLLELNNAMDDVNSRMAKMDTAVFDAKQNLKMTQRNVSDLSSSFEYILKYMGSQFDLYTSWTEWGTCSKGVQSRSRSCQSMTGGRVLCPGPFQEQRTCVELSCPADYVSLRDDIYCVKLVEIGASTDEAQNACRADGGHLVFIDTQEKQDTIMEFLRPLASNRWVWIDGARQEDNSWWNWNGEEMTYFAWNYGQPDSYTQPGISINIGAFLWHDDSGTNYYYICEKDV